LNFSSSKKKKELPSLSKDKCHVLKIQKEKKYIYLERWVNQGGDCPRTNKRDSVPDDAYQTKT